MEKGKELGFFDTGQKKWYPPVELENFSDIKNNIRGVEILRPILFFHEEQRGVTIERLKRYFKDEAISKLEHDGFIKVESLEENNETQSDNQH